MKDEKECKDSEDKNFKLFQTTPEVHMHILELTEIAKKLTSESYTIDKTFRTLFNHINYDAWMKDLKAKRVTIKPLKLKEESKK